MLRMILILIMIINNMVKNKMYLQPWYLVAPGFLDKHELIYNKGHCRKLEFEGCMAIRHGVAAFQSFTKYDKFKDKFEGCMAIRHRVAAFQSFTKCNKFKDKFEGCMTIRHRVAAFQSFTK